MTAYPSAVDYSLALQHPATAFADADLQAAEFTQGLLGPYGIAGSSAVVFHSVVAGEDCALRCYTREDASTPERYALLSAFVAENGLGKYVGSVTWYQEEVQVKGARWPVLKMAWIEGQQLNEYVGFLADGGHRGALRTLAGRWLELVSSLQDARFAHGDLQHGNILVDQQQQLRLVDFDSVWIPQLEGQEPPTESGHTSYQSQSGAGPSRWGPGMDTFSGLVIYLALTALATDPGLWAEFNNGDNLLFERDDFGPPCDTALWNRLAGLGDPEIDRIAARLKDCCAPAWAPSKSLRETLAKTWWEHGTPAPSATPATAAVSATEVAETESPAEAPASASVTAPATPPAPPALTWYKTPAAGEPAPSPESLPSAPTVPYQSTVAPQSGKPSTGGSGGPWYKEPVKIPPTVTVPAPAGKAPAAAVKAAPAKKPRRNPAVVTAWIVSALLLVAAITAAILVGLHPWKHPPVFQPTGLTVPAGVVSGTAATYSVAISWSGPATGPLPDEYQVFRDGAEVAIVAGTTTSYTDDSLTPNTAYSYQIIAVRGGKVSPASAILTVQTSPLRPTGLTLIRKTTSSLEIAWSGPATGPPPGEYQIVRDGTKVATVSGSRTSYLDKNLFPDTAYRYQVIAVTGGTASQASTTLTAAHTTKPPLSAAVLDWSGEVTQETTSIYPAWPQFSPQPGSSKQDTWSLSPDCSAGPCDVTLNGVADYYAVTTKLTRSGTTYTGTGELDNDFYCGATSDSYSGTINFDITIHGADTQYGIWTATSFSGYETINLPAGYGCLADTVQLDVKGG